MCTQIHVVNYIYCVLSKWIIITIVDYSSKVDSWRDIFYKAYKNDANHGIVWNEKKLLNFKKQNGYKAKYKRDLTILIR